MNMPDVQAVAVESAIVAGDLLKSHFDEVQRVSYKGALNNLVTDMDQRAEDLIVGRITGAFPTHQIVAEEGSTGALGGTCRWFIDPLDGTTNYAHHCPIFAVSIGFEQDGQLEAGVVYAPMLGELFEARRGQ